jgi:TPR repeat protein
LLQLSAILLTSAALVACKKDSDSAPAPPSTAKLVNVQDLRARAEQGDAQAQAALARLYAEGQQLPADYKEAGHWARKAAEQGVADGQYTLAMLIEAGRGGTNTEADAVLWARKPQRKVTWTPNTVLRSCTPPVAARPRTRRNP